MPSDTVEINGYAQRQIRVLMGVSTQDLAEAIDKTDAYVRMIEIGRSKRVSGTVYKAILSTLSIADYRVLLANPHGGAEPVISGPSPATTTTERVA